MADAAHASHGHDAHEAHPANLQHHFETPAQQFDASKLGMWIFLATEVLFFSGLFCAYVIYRVNHPEIFAAGHQYLDPIMGGINTVVLIASSFTMALGVWCAQKSYKTGLVICLALTLAGAFGFMTIKYFEYSHKIHMGLNWGKFYDPQLHHDEHGDAHAAGTPAADRHAEATDGHAASASAPAEASSHSPAAAESEPARPSGSAESAGFVVERTSVTPAPAGPSGLVAPEAAKHIDPAHARNVHIFMSIYYCMTGLHGIHVVGGIVAIGLLLINAMKGRYNGNYYTPVDLVGLYWHLVDLVWIYLFPMLYLIE